MWRTGVVTVANAGSLLDRETANSHSITVRASDAQNAYTQHTDLHHRRHSTWRPRRRSTATQPANSVAEGAANGSTVGVTAFSTDVNGPAVTYSLIGDTSGGGFTINAATGVVTVADSTKIDFEALAFNGRDSYTVTAQASDGTLSSSKTFSIAGHRGVGLGAFAFRRRQLRVREHPGNRTGTGRGRQSDPGRSFRLLVAEERT